MKSMSLILLSALMFACSSTESPTSGTITTDVTNDDVTITEEETQQVIDSLIKVNDNITEEDLKLVEKELGDAKIVTSVASVVGQYIMVDEYHSEMDKNSDDGPAFNMYVKIVGNELFVVVNIESQFFLEEHGNITIDSKNGDFSLESKMDREDNSNKELTKLLLKGDTLMVMNISESSVDIMKFIKNSDVLPANLADLDPLPHDDGNNGNSNDSLYYHNDSTFYYDSTYYYQDSNYYYDTNYYDDEPYNQFGDSTVSLIKTEWKSDIFKPTMPNGVFTLTNVVETRMAYNEDGSLMAGSGMPNQNDDELAYLVFDATKYQLTFVMEISNPSSGTSLMFKSGSNKVMMEGTILQAVSEQETTNIHILSETDTYYEYETITERYRANSAGVKYLYELSEEKGRITRSSKVINLDELMEMTLDNVEIKTTN